MFGVIDVETTGLIASRNDRVVEIAVVVVDMGGNVIREFVSLVNPERDVGPTRIHGLKASDLVNAPTFGQILPGLLEALDGTIALVGHNLRFDISFLCSEFQRLGVNFPEAQQICTMKLVGGGSLSRVCSQFGIEFMGEAHAALHDAHATARLFAALIKDEPSISKEVKLWSKIQWPQVSYCSTAPSRREDLVRLVPYLQSYLQRVISKIDPEPDILTNLSAILAYSTLLAQVLEDRHVDDEEGEALVALATEWSIPNQQIEAVHRDFLCRLEIAALADGVITEEERMDIHHVANLLGINAANLDDVINQAAKHLVAAKTRRQESQFRNIDDFAGKTICFTGELESSLNGRPISRETAMEIVESKGMSPVGSVTKKLHLLVAADVMSQSGKARKAKEYGIPVWSEQQLWKCLGIEVK